MRHALYESATSMLVHATKPSAPRHWALAVAKRRGLQKARVALARRLAVVLHRMWRDGSVFNRRAGSPRSEPTAIEIRARRGMVTPWGRGSGEDGAVPVRGILRCRGRVREIGPAALQHSILRRPRVDLEEKHEIHLADAGYIGERPAGAPIITVEIVRKPRDQVGFAVRPRRWVVERFFTWISRNRRLWKDPESTIASAKAFLVAAAVMILSRRLGRSK